MQMTMIPTFQTEVGDIIQFLPISNIPGFTHRAVVNQKSVGFLGDHTKPSKKNAEFFLRKSQGLE